MKFATYNTTKENGGSFTLTVLFFIDADVNEAGLTLPGFKNIIILDRS